MAVAIAIDPLANPKGVERLCELCQKPAFIQCAHCRVTYYCDADHQKVDWGGIHEKICQLLIPLRTPMPFFSSEEERAHRKQQLIMRQKYMIELTRTTCQKLLFEGRHEQAVPAAMQSLRFTVELYGLASVELVLSYLLLGEASIGSCVDDLIGMGKLKQAEEYLSQAQWTVLKTPGCSNAIIHKLSRKLGLLYIAKGDLDQALRELANDIYCASEEYGLNTIESSGGYFHMANIFYHKGQDDTASSLYEAVTDIWHQHLSLLVKTRLEGSLKVTSAMGNIIDESSAEEKELDEAAQAEAIHVLNTIFEKRETQSDNKTDGIAKIAHATAMLYYLLHDIDKAKEFGRRAVGASAGMQDEDFSRSIVDFLKVCEKV